MGREIKLNLFASLAMKFQSVFFLPILYTFLASLGVIMSIWRRGDMHFDAKTDPVGSKDLATYDFIIVGAGTAGCLVANRLSQYYNVLLLEAGGEPNPLQSIPAFGLFLWGYPEIDWNHRSVPQTGGTLLSVNQQSSWSTGKGLGGSGNLNLMLYLRGNPRDYDNWARILDDPSWSYEEMVPFFKKHENYRIQNVDGRYQGFKGELGIELPDFTGIADDFVKGGQDLGYREIDVNTPHSEGFFKLQHTQKRGVRDTPYTAFLRPISFRKSLTIHKYAQVNKILFRDGNKEVYGVEYDRHGRTRTAICTKEVIVSAGTVTTPKLLMLSGIGPHHHLKSLGIPVRHDLPVGENLQDHLGVHLGPFFINQPKTFNLERDATAEAIVQWLTKGTGVFSSSMVQASAVFSSIFAKTRGEGDWPDIQLFAFGFSLFRTSPELFNHALNLKLDVLAEFYKNDFNKESFLIVVSGARPHSRGWIKLGGKSPYDNVIIEPNYLKDSHSIDVKVLVEGMKVAVEMVENTPTFRKLGGQLSNASLPGCEHLSFRSDPYWECFARIHSATLHHPCCSASMGKHGSRNSVVDPELRVHGVSNLRVIDASVMPTIVATNTQAGTYGIAEKGSHMILKYWKHKQEGGPPQGPVHNPEFYDKNNYQQYVDKPPKYSQEYINQYNLQKDQYTPVQSNLFQHVFQSDLNNFI